PRLRAAADEGALAAPGPRRRARERHQRVARRDLGRAQRSAQARPILLGGTMRRATLALSIACIGVSAALAADDPKQRQDLTAVIALQGRPCGEGVSYSVQGDND